MQSVDYKCPSCNAYLHFNPKEQNWICDYCGSNFSLENLKDNNDKFEKATIKENNTDKVQLNEYHCADCGATIVADENTAATFCVYCKNTAILKDKLVGIFAPNYIIPFNNTKEEAIAAFKKVGKGKILMPKEFADIKNIQKMTGIYIPFWLIDCTLSGSIEAAAKRVTTSRLGEYIQTRTDSYIVKRGGNVGFDKIPADGSVRFDDAIMNSIEPFSYTALKDFDSSYLSGFLAEKYDVEKEKGEEIANERAKQSFKKLMENQINGYTSYSVKSTNIVISPKQTNYVLLPVWMLNIKYKNKMYTFAMNGQTGKMIGNIPWSKPKAIILFLVVFIVITIILALTVFGGVL